MSVGGVHEHNKQEHDHEHTHNHDHSQEEHDASQAAQVQEESDVEMDGRHTVATEADTAVRAHLGDYVKQAVSQGKRIEGRATVVEGEGWDRAGIAHYGAARWAQRKDKINAFVDKNSKVWLHRKRGNAGTMVHEAVHIYAKKAVLRESQPLNEGITEYFTRKICAKLHPSLRRRNYQQNYTTVTKLVDYTSEEVVAQAYFDGLLAYLRRDFNKAYGAKTGWSTFAHKCSDDDWRGARRVMDTKAQVIPPKTALPKADFSKGGLPALY